MDKTAKMAQKILDELNPNANSTAYRLEEIYKLWTSEFSKKRECLYDDAKKAVDLGITAPVTRYSSASRVFRVVSSHEILDTVKAIGRRCPTDRGFSGLNSPEDNFGYNG